MGTSTRMPDGSRAGRVQPAPAVALPAMALPVARATVLDVGAIPRERDHDFWQMRAGPFRVDTAMAELPGVVISSENVNTLVRSCGVSPANFLAVSIASSAPRPTLWGGRAVVKGDAAIVGSRRELDCIVDGGGFVQVAVVREGLRGLFLNEPDAAALLDRWTSRIGLLRAHPDAVRRLDAFADALLRSNGCATPELAAHAADCALSLLTRLLLGATEAPPRHGPGRPSERHKMALAAERVILSEAWRPLSVRRVCAAIGASERALEIAFREHFGTAPARYIRAVRIHRVHRDLLSAGPGASVTDVAYRHGFWHLARFAAYYRRMFQELPSITLARARGRNPSAPVAAGSAGRG